jgi:hypothetical protein
MPVLSQKRPQVSQSRPALRDCVPRPCGQGSDRLRRFLHVERDIGWPTFFRWQRLGNEQQVAEPGSWVVLELTVQKYLIQRSS